MGAARMHSGRGGGHEADGGSGELAMRNVAIGLGRLMNEAGKVLPPPGRLDIVFQRLIAKLAEDERRGIPVARIKRRGPPKPTA